MSYLQINSRIIVQTTNGEREIQLCVGDITRLNVESKVDVILVSAFTSNYSNLRTSVIGALKINLGIDVGLINRTRMKQDLRKNFHCWISKELPSRSPYRQLMCFERGKNRNGQKTILDSVQELFRAMMPLFNNQSKTVITPLLATGFQNTDRGDMMKIMIETAVNWMKIGLPLQTLKIVVYAKNPNSIGEREKPCLKVFEEMKKRLQGQKHILEEPGIAKGIFLVHSRHDEDLANVLKTALRKEKGITHIVTISDIKISEDTWQHDVFMAMLSSARVVPILSQSFLEEETCLDQYNIALCCNRFTRRPILAPICVERFSVPLYMGTVQWINCKERDTEKLKTAAKSLNEHITKKETLKEKQYDIFISYSHKNMGKAKAVLNQVQQSNPDLDIFFDYAELKTGVSWQKTLYEALDSSRCIVALISSDYIKSVVCNEEFNIALSRHLTKSQNCKLVPIMMESMNEEITKMVKHFPLLDASGANFETCSQMVCEEVCQWLKDHVYNERIFGPVMDPVDIELIQEQKRKQEFNTLYEFNSKECQFQMKINTQVEKNTIQKQHDECGCDLFISSSLHDQRFVQFVVTTLQKQNNSLKISDKLHGSESQITDARCLLVFLSPSYMNSPKEIEELNLIISKERSLCVDDRKQIYVVVLEEMSDTPSYIQLLPCDTSICDDLWGDFLQDSMKSSDFHFNSDVLLRQKSLRKEFQTGLNDDDVLALLKVVCDLQVLLCDAMYHIEVYKPTGLFINVQSLNEDVNTMDTLILPEDQNLESVDQKEQEEEQEEENQNQNKVNQVDDNKSTSLVENNQSYESAADGNINGTTCSEDDIGLKGKRRSKSCDLL